MNDSDQKLMIGAITEAVEARKKAFLCCPFEGCREAYEISGDWLDLTEWQRSVGLGWRLLCLEVHWEDKHSQRPDPILRSIDEDSATVT